MHYDNEARAIGAADPGLPWNPFKALVAPRPIAWVTTRGADGLNLAPFSYFQAVADRPDVLMLSLSSVLAQTSDGALRATQHRKDTERNIVATGQFVVNLAPWALRDHVNASSAHLPGDVDEAAMVGLDLTDSRRVSVPRLAAAPAALECRLLSILPVPGHVGDDTYHLVFGEVLSTYVADEHLGDDGRVDTAGMGLLTRLGYDEYAVLDRVFRMTRPDLDTIQQGLVR